MLILRFLNKDIAYSQKGMGFFVYPIGIGETPKSNESSWKEIERWGQLGLDKRIHPI
jgi:hypothetical protein